MRSGGAERGTGSGHGVGEVRRRSSEAAQGGSRGGGVVAGMPVRRIGAACEAESGRRTSDGNGERERVGWVTGWDEYLD